MNVNIDDKAKKWIESKGKPVRIEIMQMQGCCVIGPPELVATPGKPKAEEQFNEIKLDNISIYIHKHIRVKDTLILKLSGISFLKSISAKAVLI
ncbi:CC/Se motif family (seleno)protein [Jeotgalibacillus soli]|uniref:Fe-S oxidoreductase n=1 Tax=Jeotgalibacillus soli TaxID=889306 RepID=A0A0C2V8K1_9BACL|nr:CC/Se motif family (seleno)protein [Jeotgalibacillus soli]KIL45287.1 hypothetical protein KP78_28310 [Jeotgalibacillus soli]